ncbi:MAG: 30S ribosomal protein S19e [Thermoplasmatota archaeon]
MTTVHDVPAELLLANVAEKLQSRAGIKAPEWAPYAKTGIHREKAPANADWWPLRAGAVLRKVYLLGPIGTERLRAEFGGSRDRGAAPNRAKKGSGSVVREMLQQLEAEGLVVNVKGEGRKVTPQGQKLLDNASYEVKQKIVAEIPAIAKY